MHPNPSTDAGGPGTHITQRVRLAYLVSHPIQYQTPLLRRIAAEPVIELTVFFGSDFSVRGYRDRDFGVDVKWDVPLTDGFRHEFLPKLRDTGVEGIFSPINYGLLSRLRGFDALWVHGYATVTQMQGILAANFLGVPVLVRSDSQLKDRPRGGARLAAKRVFFALLKHLVDGVLVSGTLNRDYWRHYLGEDSPLFLLPYAVDNAWFQQRCRDSSATRDTLLAELGLQPGRAVILFASKLQTRKLCGDLVSAYATYIDRLNAAPYLLIVGDGEERAALEEQVANLGLDSVRFCGFRNQTEMPRFLELADVFVLPARHEPWGLIVNEAMNAGCAVVVSDDVGCHPDLVTDGVEGRIYPVGDVAALSAALGDALDHADAMGSAALRRIESWSFEADVAGLKRALAHVTRKLPGARA